MTTLEPSVNLVEFRQQQAAAVLARRVPARFADAKVTHPEIRAWVDRYLTNPRETPSIVVAGPTGVGKTYQCWGAIREIVQALAARGKGLRWASTTHPDLNHALRPKGDGSHEHALDPYLRAELLFLDDLGAGKQSEWTGDSLFRLVDHRWATCLPTIYSTNLSPDALVNAVGDRIVSRLADSVRVTLSGRDRRWGVAA